MNMNFPGGKGGTYQKYINLMPPHEVYIESQGLVLTSATLLRDLTQHPNKCYKFTWLNFLELVL